MAAVASFFASIAVAPVLADCTGDCGANDEVTLGEVQKAFAIFLRSSGLEDCAAADTSRDGQIGLGEVQTSFQNFLLGCIFLDGSCLRPAPAGSPPPGLMACAPGTEVRALGCTDRNRSACLSNPAMLTELDSGGVAADGTFSTTVDATAPQSGAIVLEAEVEPATKYRVISFGPLSARGVGGGAQDAGEIVISPVTEAAVRLIDANGFEGFSTEGVADTITAVEEANRQTSFAGTTAGTAAARATDIAGADADVQETIRLAMGEDLEGECRGTIHVEPRSGFTGELFVITVTVAPPFDSQITRVGTTNPGGEFDLESQGGGRFTRTLFYEGSGPFTLSFSAFDSGSVERCSGEISLEALGPA